MNYSIWWMCGFIYELSMLLYSLWNMLVDVDNLFFESKNVGGSFASDANNFRKKFTKTLKLSNDSIGMANNKEFNQFNWAKNAFAYSSFTFFIQLLQNHLIRSKFCGFKWLTEKYYTLSGKNGDSIFVFYSFFGLLSHKL